MNQPQRSSASILHTLRTYHGVRELPNLLRFTAQYDHLQAIVVIQMNVKRGRYIVLVLMLL